MFGLLVTGFNYSPLLSIGQHWRLTYGAEGLRQTYWSIGHFLRHVLLWSIHV